MKNLWLNITKVFNGNTKKASSNSYHRKSHKKTASKKINYESELKDKDLQFLFIQLLEGVVNGWQQHRIEQFFKKLEHRITIDEWLQWLERFEEKIMLSAAPNYQLAARMIILGETTTSLPFVRPLGDLAYQIGEGLLSKKSHNSLVESLRSYLVGNLPRNSNFTETEEDLDSSYILINMIKRLQINPVLLEQIAENSGLKTTELSLIVERLLQQEENKQISQSQTQQVSLIDLEIEPISEDSSGSFEGVIDNSAEEIEFVDNYIDSSLEEIDSMDSSIEIEEVEFVDNYIDSSVENTKEVIEDVSEFSEDVTKEITHNDNEFSQNIVEEIVEDSVDSSEQELINNDVQFWFESGLNKIKSQDFEGAIADWQKVVEKDPLFSKAWHNLGSAFAYLNRTEEALKSFDQAININVKDYQSWDNRGNFLYNLHRWEEALISWDRVVGIKPNYYQAWYSRGLALEKLNLIEKAIQNYEKALEIEPNFKMAQKRKDKLLNKVFAS